jgi:hypothetical protein
LKDGKDSFRRTTAFYLLCEWVGDKVFPSLPPVLLQSLIKDRLKFGVEVDASGW